MTARARSGLPAISIPGAMRAPMATACDDQRAAAPMFAADKTSADAAATGSDVKACGRSVSTIVNRLESNKSDSVPPARTVIESGFVVSFPHVPITDGGALGVSVCLMVPFQHKTPGAAGGAGTMVRSDDAVVAGALSSTSTSDEPLLLHLSCRVSSGSVHQAIGTRKIKGMVGWCDERLPDDGSW